MINDIFAAKRTSAIKKQNLPFIIADIHEKNSLVISEIYSSKQVDIEIKPLKIGDYLIGDIILERKTVSDFISSMINKRIFEQLNQMKQYKTQLLILEGDLNDSDFNPNAIRGFIISILTNYQIPIIFTKDYKDTADYLILFSKQQLKPKTEISLHSRIPKTLKEQKQYILEAFPNIGPVTARKLIEKFKTLGKIFNASEEELKDILKNKTDYFKGLIAN